MNRAEVFEGTGPTPGSYIRVKMGADKAGRLTAARRTWPTRPAPIPARRSAPAAMCVFACYDIPNVHIDGYDVVVNKPATSAYRAPGATNAAFAAETVVDEICEKLKIDPLEFRIKNGASEGTRRADGPIFPRIGMIETVEAAKKHPHYKAPLGGPNRGRGVASGFWFNSGLKSSATASVNADGTCQPGRRLHRHRRHAHRRSPCSWPRRSASAPRTSSPSSPTPTRSATPT